MRRFVEVLLCVAISRPASSFSALDITMELPLQFGDSYHRDVQVDTIIWCRQRVSDLCSAERFEDGESLVQEFSGIMDSTRLRR